MALAFHRDGNKLFVTVTSDDKNNSVILEVERTLGDGTVQKNPIAYERYESDIVAFKAEKSTAAPGTRKASPPHSGNLTSDGNLTDADLHNQGRSLPHNLTRRK